MIDPTFALDESPTVDPGLDIDVELTADELALCEQLLSLQRQANATPGHDWLHSTYGKIGDALLAAIAQSVRNAQRPAQLLPATAIALAIIDSAVDNGENIAYQLDLMRDGYLKPWSPR